jgi:hypothetical protein
MQAAEVKPEVEQRVLAAQSTPAPIAEPPTPLAGEAPRSGEEHACCAVPARRARAWPWLIGGATLVALALYGTWDWFVATGLATVLVAVGPCLLMCALGLCMGRAKSKGETSLAEVRKTYEADSGPRQLP